MEALNNPAARFHALLKQGQSQGKDEQSSKVWEKLLNVPSGQTPLLLQRIGHVMELPSLIEAEIHELENVNHNIYLKWLPRVNASVGMLNFQNPWKSFIDRFDAEILYGIEICADTLSRSRPEKIISESTLNELAEKVTLLQKEFTEQSLPSNVALFISQHLEEIRLALEEYPFRGSAPLETALKNSIGGVVISPNVYQDCQKTPYGKKFWEFMGYLAISVTITTGAIQIGKDVVTLLPSAIESPDVETPTQTEKNPGERSESDNETNPSSTIKT